MKEYFITVKRTFTMIARINAEGDSPEDAAERFQHQLEAGQCSSIEDGELWGEAFYYQIAKGDPYSSEYEVLEIEEA